ncbi:MAG: dolichol-phosphate mannosyltransferase [Candidatus Peregrinibacteria bacterium Gr01-1014_25]|nr:MAG: dolichol-phosphate mannosyltransferase [Candidatus Peregrinibacteria bacterium Gr01-1014_25]
MHEPVNVGRPREEAVLVCYSRPMASRTLVIIPTYNERDNIGTLVTALLKQHADLDVLVVDDGSPDGTADVVRSLLKQYPHRLLIDVRDGKGGRGSAVLHGFRRALAGGYALAIEMDADFSHKPEEIPRLLAAIEHADMVLGSRYLSGSEIHRWGWRRTFFSRWANRYARFVLGIPITDYTNGFRCYRRSALEALNFECIHARGYVVLSEVAYQLHLAGMRIAEVPTVFVNRRRGISNLSLHEITEAFLSVLAIRRRYGRRKPSSTSPL